MHISNTGVLLAYFSALPAAVCATPPATPGHMQISGELLAGTCESASASHDTLIDFGVIPARLINASPAGYPTREISLRLNACPALAHGSGLRPYSYATLTLSGEHAQGDPSALAVSGDVDGIALRFRDAQGHILRLGEPSENTVLYYQHDVMTVFASVIRIKPTIRSGNFNALVRYSLNYN
ncbi:fimbrial protein [Pantoea sp. 1.19]|uniref:fimbrial protein n=1 Tax=Pantoea sp. 1.19 TaxID=1925589 RepID=UPI0009488E53|nr:fimbrial protein [Pantoea sp. 1.19]